jgi:hypothetical protein
MRLAKLADACLYFMAGSVIFAVVAAFVGQMSEGATAEEYQDHYEKVSEPIILTASEAAEANLEEANKPVKKAVASCVNGVCGVVESVQENKPVRTAVRSSCQRVRRGIFFRWRRR